MLILVWHYVHPTNNYYYATKEFYGIIFTFYKHCKCSATNKVGFYTKTRLSSQQYLPLNVANANTSRETCSTTSNDETDNGVAPATSIT